MKETADGIREKGVMMGGPGATQEWGKVTRLRLNQAP